MTWTWQNPDRGPTPAELAAWADGELGPAEARWVEGWLADHPEAVDEAEVARRLVGLFRDHGPPEPSHAAWQATLEGIRTGLSAPRQAGQGSRWRLRLVLGLVSAAAVLGGLLVAGLSWPRANKTDNRDGLVEKDKRPPLPPADDDPPFAVVGASEVNIISMDAEDADRLLMDQPLLGTVEFAAPEDIEVVGVLPDPEEGSRSRLQRGPQVPMIVLARNEDEEP